MNNAVLYIHGKGGSAAEADLYKELFPEYAVKGFDYKSNTPWEFKEEVKAIIKPLSVKYDRLVIIANSIGAFFIMNADINELISRAFFISPIVDMERLIKDMMMSANVTESELKEKGNIKTAFGEELSWQYLSYVREHPIKWNVPCEILYGDKDNLTSSDTIVNFAKAHNAGLTVMPNGEHWFHTDEQMEFLKNWIMYKLYDVV